MVIDLSKPLTPEEWADIAVKARDANHHVDVNDEPKNPSFGAAMRDKYVVGNAVNYDDRKTDPAYFAIRGREQQLIDSNGGAWSDTGGKDKPHKTENSIRGVSKDEPRGKAFHLAANAVWQPELHKYTGK